MSILFPIDLQEYLSVDDSELLTDLLLSRIGSVNIEEILEIDQLIICFTGSSNVTMTLMNKLADCCDHTVRLSSNNTDFGQFLYFPVQQTFICAVNNENDFQKVRTLVYDSSRKLLRMNVL